MWATPVESFGGVRNVAPKHLFSSLLVMESSSAPGGVVPPQFDGAGNFGKPFLAHEAKAVGIHLDLLISQKGSEKGPPHSGRFPSRASPSPGGFAPERCSPFTWAAAAARRHYGKE